MKQRENDQPLKENSRDSGRSNDQIGEDSTYTSIESLVFASEKSFTIDLEPTETMVICCADPRFRKTFQEFVREELKIGHHTLLSLAGGVGPFVRFNPDSEKSKQMIDQLRLFILSNGIKKLVVLNHADCRWYSALLPDSDLHYALERQISDLQYFAHMVRIEIDEVAVRSFIAVFDDEKVRFKQVPTKQLKPHS